MGMLLEVGKGSSHEFCYGFRAHGGGRSGRAALPGLSSVWGDSKAQNFKEMVGNGVSLQGGSL